MSNDGSAWLARAVADADARNLPELRPLLEGLSRSLHALRAADAEFRHPAILDPPSAHPGNVPSSGSDR
jgi:hypothetical protein